MDGVVQPHLASVTEALKPRKKGSWGSPAGSQAVKDQPSPASCATYFRLKFKKRGKHGFSGQAQGLC